MDENVVRGLREWFRKHSFVVPNPDAPTGSLVVMSYDDVEDFIRELEGKQ